ncbi:MAG: hypothetical protein KF708_04480 [Pirellulales bacterium]|nr:hypothetical protein [Pirellulales bacterium]
MFVRLFRYRVLPERLNRYLAIQEQAGNIYRRHDSVRTSYFQSAGDPCTWLEVHWYPDESTCRRVTEEISSEPVIAELWQEFQRTLDPHFEASIEEYHSPGKS